MKKAVILSAALLCAHSVFAGYYNGNDLNTWSESAERIANGKAQTLDYQAAALLNGYISGVVDSMDGVFLCVPDGTTTKQLRFIVVKHLHANPEKWRSNASLTIFNALSPVFPCANKQL